MKSRAVLKSMSSISMTRMLAALGLAVGIAAPVWAAAPESMAPDQWRTFMAHKSAEVEGCFHASYPNTTWERVNCEDAPKGVHPVHINSKGLPEVAGSGDYVAQTKKMITLASGSFAISGVTSEYGVSEFNNNGVPLGILGSDQYSIQLNTNELETTSACKGRSGCRVWQQFVYANNYPTATSGGKVFMQYWLLNYNSAECPASGTLNGKPCCPSSSWTPSYASCYMNTQLLSVPSVPITQLGEVGLTASAQPNGMDQVAFVYDNDSWSIFGQDSVLNIATVWNKAEFNVVGNAGGSQAQFNYGTTITVSLVVGDGTGTAPTCVKDDGTTGESNNLSVGPCTASDAFLPMIQYTETY